MSEENLIPQLSLSERDRRYSKVRERMAREGIDVLLLSANHSRWEQMMADSRYLTCIGGFATLKVFTRFRISIIAISLQPGGRLTKLTPIIGGIDNQGKHKVHHTSNGEQSRIASDP